MPTHSSGTQSGFLLSRKEERPSSHLEKGNLQASWKKTCEKVYLYMTLNPAKNKKKIPILEVYDDGEKKEILNNANEF